MTFRRDTPLPAPTALSPVLAGLLLSDFVKACTTEGFETAAADLAGLSAEDAQVLSEAAVILCGVEARELARLCDWRQWALRSEESPATLTSAVDQTTRAEDLAVQFVCPITQDVMADPVVCADGQTYEHLAIQRWFAQGRNTSPATNLPLANTMSFPCIVLRNVIHAAAPEARARFTELRETTRLVRSWPSAILQSFS